MSQQAAWDWKKIVLVVAGGAATLVFGLVAMATAGFVWAASTAERLGEPAPEPVTRAIGIQTASEPVSGASGEPLRLDIELQDGTFEIRPGPPGTEVQVEGEYASSYYELSEEHTPAGEAGGPATRIRLRRSQPFLVQLVAEAFSRSRGAPNALTITIPVEVPIALVLRLSAAESRIDLGGLTLTDLEADLAMGEHRLDFSEPLAGEPRRVRVDGSMGMVRLESLGNARAMELEVTGSMGSLTADLGGDWPRDVVPDLTLTNSMGELRLAIPADVRIAPDSDISAALGETDRIVRADDTSGEGPVVRLHLSTSMGETRVRRY